jgi:hypothetical protein
VLSKSIAGAMQLVQDNQVSLLAAHLKAALQQKLQDVA